MKNKINTICDKKIDRSFSGIHHQVFSPMLKRKTDPQVIEKALLEIQLYLAHFRILILAEDICVARRIENLLHNTQIQFTVKVARNENEYMDALATFGPDVIYSDHYLQQYDAISAVQVLRARDMHTPFIMIAEQFSGDLSAMCLSEGITDYLLRSDLDRLPISLVNALRSKKNEEEVRQSNEQLHKSFGELKQTSERFSQAQEIAHLGNWEMNFASGRSVWSDEACRIYGVPQQERHQQTFDSWLSFVHPHDLHMVRKEIVASQAKLSDSSFEHRIVLKDGTVKHIHSVAKFEFDEKRTPVGLFGICHDITKRKTSEKELQESKEISDSIRYAKNIQESMLPSEQWLKNTLPEHFVLYKPKDIVSGDFYWAEKVGDKVIFAVVDCTGHGVPGAFVSIVCHNALNRVVSEFPEAAPDKILDKVSQLIEQAFSRSDNQLKDGMDIALCCLDVPKKQLHYAGANNDLYLVTDGELKNIRADKQPAARYFDRKPFSSHSIQLKENDTFYIFSDGYVDQFGGPAQKKFKTARLKETLLAIQGKTMEDQKEFLTSTIEQWMGDLEQVDDICMMGIRMAG